MPVTSEQASELYRQVLSESSPSEIRDDIDVTNKGGGGSLAPLIKRLVLSRLAGHPLGHDLHREHGDVYSTGVPPQDARFSFRVTASSENKAWTNVTRAEATEFVESGGIFLMIWNPPDANRDRQLIAFCVPPSHPEFSEALQAPALQERVMFRITQTGNGDLFVGRLGDAEPFPIPEAWVTRIRLNEAETKFLLDGPVVPDRLTRELRGQGFERSSKIRRALEDHAMAMATDYLAEEGYEVEDVHTKKPYDLIARRGGERSSPSFAGKSGRGRRHGWGVPPLEVLVHLLA